MNGRICLGSIIWKEFDVQTHQKWYDRTQEHSFRQKKTGKKNLKISKEALNMTTQRKNIIKFLF